MFARPERQYFHCHTVYIVDLHGLWCRQGKIQDTVGDIDTQAIDPFLIGHLCNIRKLFPYGSRLVSLHLAGRNLQRKAREGDLLKNILLDGKRNSPLCRYFFQFCTIGKGVATYFRNICRKRDA